MYNIYILQDIYIYIYIYINIYIITYIIDTICKVYIIYEKYKKKKRLLQLVLRFLHLTAFTDVLIVVPPY